MAPGAPGGARAGDPPEAGERLAVRRLRKAFGPVVAVDDVSLTVADGEFVALLGPSGCGKTTTLRMIAGFEEPDRGEVLIRGVPVTGLPPFRRDVGLVFQSYALFPHMTVGDNVAYGLRMRKVPREERRRRVDAALELVRLQGLTERLPRELSGGQQQRVAVARAIVIHPSVLLLDEPLSNLDARLREEMREELRALQRRLRIATILVTHDQDEALSMADRIVVMNGGRVEQTGPPEDVYQRPTSVFVAEFVGRNNFLRGRIAAAEGETALFEAESGLAFRIARPASAVPGQRGTVGIRPEGIVLGDEAGAPWPGANVVRATVELVTYLGALRKYRVVTETGQRLQVDRVAGPLDAERRPPREGASVWLAWLPASGTFEAAPARGEGT